MAKPRVPGVRERVAPVPLMSQAGETGAPMKILKWVAVVVAALTLAVSSGAGTADAAPKPTYKPCRYEDSPGPCYWDAGSFGNGRGHSFYVTPTQRVRYVRDLVVVRGWHAAPNSLRARQHGRKVTVLIRPAWHKAPADLVNELIRDGWRGVNGKRIQRSDRGHCWERIGDTSYLVCRSGFFETS
ncbi:hypothetical protein SEA_VIEENROSE_72 [Streptomyces phage VieEnRose]|nr:hypothetical protein SEA_VIEENROSE_72 [Streptomyces phage VieEnRose]